MNTGNVIKIAGWTLILAAGNALAQDLDQTIRIIDQPQANMPATVTDPIVLPADVNEDSEAVEAIATANTARLRRVEGLEIAAEAIETAAEFADAAQDNAESFSRTDEFVPDVPEVPVVPDPTGGR